MAYYFHDECIAAAAVEFSPIHFTALHCTVCVCTVTNSQFDTIALALNRSIIHRTFLWATVSCSTEMLKLGFTKVNSVVQCDQGTYVEKVRQLTTSQILPSSFQNLHFSSCASGGVS